MWKTRGRVLHAADEPSRSYEVFFVFFLFFFPTLECLSENKKRLLAERQRKAAVCLFSQCDRPRLIECWLYRLMQTGFSIYINVGAAFRQIHVEIGVDNTEAREGKKAGCVINSADMLEQSKNTFLLQLHKQKMLVWTTAAESHFFFNCRSGELLSQLLINRQNFATD